MLFFLCDAFRFYIGGHWSSANSSVRRWPAELHLLLVLFGGGPGWSSGMVDLTHSSGSENKRMRETPWDLCLFFLWGGKQRGGFLLQTAGSRSPLEDLRSFFWDEGFWMVGWIMLNLSSFSVRENLGFRGTNLIFGGSPRDHLWPLLGHVLNLHSHYLIFTSHDCILVDRPKKNCRHWHLAPHNWKKIQWFPSEQVTWYIGHIPSLHLSSTWLGWKSSWNKIRSRNAPTRESRRSHQVPGLKKKTDRNMLGCLTRRYLFQRISLGYVKIQSL